MFSLSLLETIAFMLIFSSVICLFGGNVAGMESPFDIYTAAMQSTSMSNPPFQAGTLTKIRAGGSFGKYRL